MFKNGEDVTKEYCDCCPEHGTPEKKQYDFGLRDATVITFSGCKCAVRINSWNEVAYFTSYTNASGSATLVKIQNKW